VAKARKKSSGNTLPLFAEEDPAPSSGSYVAVNRERLKQWAARGILFGTSSWKYPGGKGMVYNRSYPSKRDFEQECLSEYASVFPTVCADFALYDFPQPLRMKAMFDQTPDHFTVSFKVTDRITIKRYPNLPRHGGNAGQENPDFLNVALFEDAFLRPLDELRQKCGVIIFEFSTFYPSSGITFPVFVSLIDAFFAKLPKNHQYAVEIRNTDFLKEEYLTTLRTHGVAHVLNSWTRMPPVAEQLAVPGVLTAPFTTVRALLKPGRTYQEAVEQFQPYERIQEPLPDLRRALVETVLKSLKEEKKVYAYVNNRAEGNSPKTIEAILDVLDDYPVEKL
jgi:uncharacterized protein YecE (DUF72 family)